MIKLRFYVPTGQGVSRPSRPVPIRKRDRDGVGTLKSIHAGKEEERGKKERKMKKEKSERKEKEK